MASIVRLGCCRSMVLRVMIVIFSIGKQRVYASNKRRRFSSRRSRRSANAARAILVGIFNLVCAKKVQHISRYTTYTWHCGTTSRTSHRIELTGSILRPRPETFATLTQLLRFRGGATGADGP